MAKKTKKMSRAVGGEPAQELVRFRRLVKEQVELGKAVCRMREVAVQAGVDLWEDGYRSVASRGASDEAITAAVGRLVQSTIDYGTAVKRMHDHGASLGSIASAAGMLDEVEIDEIRCAMLFSD